MDAPVIAAVSASPTAGSTASDLASAQIAAATNGYRVEALSERTEISTTWANPDGTLTTDTSESPIRIRDADADGGWRNLDYTLVAQPDGTIAPKSGYAPIVLSGKATAAEVKADGVISITSDSDKSISLGWDGSLPTPILDGASITYPNVKPNLDLVVDLTATGFEQYFVLKQQPATSAPISLALPLLGDDIDATELSSGTIKLADEDKTTVGTIPAPYMWDSSGDDGSKPDKSVKLDMHLDNTGDGQSVVLNPDAGFLGDPSVQYPVIIDPTIVLNPSYDTYVQSNMTTTDFHTSTELHVGVQTDGGAVTRSFLAFDDSAFQAAQVQSATLTLFQNSSTTCTATPMTVSASSVPNGNTRWGAQPTLYAGYSTTVSASRGHDASACPAGSYGIDVTDITNYLASKNIPTIGMSLTASETLRSGWKNFNSSENTLHAPNLSVTYNRYPVTLPTVTIGSTQLLNGALTTVDRAPSFTGTSTDPDGNTVLTRFEMRTSTSIISADTLAATCDTTFVASGSSATCVAGNEVDDGTYYVRATASDNRVWAKAWTPWVTLVIASNQPQVPVVSCPAPYVDAYWSDELPAAPVMCQVTVPPSSAATAAVRLSTSVDGGSPAVTTFAAATGTTVPLSLTRTTGAHSIEATTTNTFGADSEPVEFDLGYGDWANLDGSRTPADSANTNMRPSLNVTLGNTGYDNSQVRYVIGTTADPSASTVYQSEYMSEGAFEVPQNALKPATKYYWKALSQVSRDDFQTIDRTNNSPVWSFTTSNAAPLAPTITDVSPNSGTALPVTVSTTPAFFAQESDPDADLVDVTFEVYALDAQGNPSGLVSSCTSESTESDEVAACRPTAALADGTSYSVRARSSDGQAQSGWSGWIRLTTSKSVLPPAQSADWLPDITDSADLGYSTLIEGTVARPDGTLFSQGARVEVDALPSSEVVAGLQVGDSIQKTPVAKALIDSTGAFLIRLSDPQSVSRFMSSDELVDYELSVVEGDYYATYSFTRQFYRGDFENRSASKAASAGAEFIESALPDDNALVSITSLPGNPNVGALEEAKNETLQKGESCTETMVEDLGERKTVLAATYATASKQTAGFTRKTGASTKLASAISGTAKWGTYKISGSVTMKGTKKYQQLPKAGGYTYWTKFNFAKFKDLCFPSPRAKQTLRYEVRARSAQGLGGSDKSTAPSTQKKYCADFDANSIYTQDNEVGKTFSVGISIKAAIGIDLSSESNFTSTLSTDYHNASTKVGLMCGTDDTPAGNPKILVSK